MIFRQTVPFERYLEIGHVLGLSRVFINHLAASAIVVFCMTYCLYTVKRKRLKLGKTTNKKNTIRTTAMLILIMLIFVKGELLTTVDLCFD
jgi:EamA domain-containing membrane protein RarD